jgi:hypothetical protein
MPSSTPRIFLQQPLPHDDMPSMSYMQTSISCHPMQHKALASVDPPSPSVCAVLQHMPAHDRILDVAY